MNNLEYPLPELLNMLIITQAQIKGKRQEGVLAIASSSRSFKKRRVLFLRKKSSGQREKFPRARTQRRDQGKSVSTATKMGIGRGIV